MKNSATFFILPAVLFATNLAFCGEAKYDSHRFDGIYSLSNSKVSGDAEEKLSCPQHLKIKGEDLAIKLQTSDPVGSMMPSIDRITTMWSSTSDSKYSHEFRIEDFAFSDSPCTNPVTCLVAATMYLDSHKNKSEQNYVEQDSTQRESFGTHWRENISLKKDRDRNVTFVVDYEDNEHQSNLMSFGAFKTSCSYKFVSSSDGDESSERVSTSGIAGNKSKENSTESSSEVKDTANGDSSGSAR